MTVSKLSAALVSLVMLAPACDSGEKKPEVKADAKPDVKAETKPEVKAEAKPEVKPDAKPEVKADVKPDPTPEPTPTPAVVVAPGGPGPAYFVVDKTGVVRLDGGKFTVLADSPNMLAKGLQVGGDGKVWVAGFQDISRLDGDAFKPVVKAGFSELGGSIEDFVVAPDGQIWAVTFKGVSHHDGKAWSTEEKAAIGAGSDLLKGVALDKNGRVWVASTHKVHVRDGGAWKDVDLTKAGPGRTLYFEELELGPDNSVHALASSALFHIGPNLDQVEKVKLGGRSISSYGKLGVSSNGGLVVVDIDTVIARAAGGETSSFAAGKQFKPGNIHAVAADDGGRVWVASEAGVTVLGPNDAKTEWLGGSVPELTGDVRGILVVGAGPAELPTAGPVRKGGLTGKLLQDGSPLADVAIEICPSPGMIFSKSPCADGAVKFSGKSDANGVWTVSDVPLGTYGIAVKLGGKWQITLGSKIGEGMKEGQVYDTGSLTLDKK